MKANKLTTIIQKKQEKQKRQTERQDKIDTRY